MANTGPGKMKTPTAIRDTNSNGTQFDYTSLKKFIDVELSGEKANVEKVNALKKTLSEERRKTQLVAEKKAVRELADLEGRLAKEGMKLSATQQKKFLAEFEAEKQKAEKQVLLDYWKEHSKVAEKERAKEEKKFNKEFEIQKKIAKLREEGKDKEANRKEFEHEIGLAFGEQLKDQFKDFNEALKNPGKEIGKVLGEDLGKMGKALGQSLNALSDAVNTSIKTYQSYQTGINARLQGLGTFEDSVKTLEAVSYSPLLKTEDLYANLSSLIAEGIAENVEQRAFLATVKDGIATTFDANNSTLMRLIKLQSQDSTAARLGMEAYLTTYLNQLNHSTEYLNSTFDTVAESLIEASALLQGNASTEFEFIVQKWLGSLSGMGLSDNTTQAIGAALGQLGSGDVTSLSGSEMQNLLVMAASRSGLNYSELLNSGLNASNTNQLMYGLTSYLAELGGSTTSNVARSQLAQTFGVSVSDLLAAQNSMSAIDNIYKTTMSYTDMYDELNSQMNKLQDRIGIANILDNLFSNFSFSNGMNIASNPALFATWKITDMIQNATGGINIPFITAMGSGVDLNATVEGLMKLGLVGLSTLGGIGDIVSGMSSLGKEGGSSMLSKLGITSGNDVITRGNGLGRQSTSMSSVSTSFSSFVGNSNGSDYGNSALASAKDSVQSEVDAKNEEKTVMDDLNDYVQGEQKELYKAMLDNVRDLNKSIKDGITVSLSDSSITGITSSMYSGVPLPQ